MATDDERRDVARRLREWTWKSAPPECLLNQLVFGDDCPGTDDDPDTIDCHQCEVIAAKRLADLVEPPTQCSYYHSERHYCSAYDDVVDREALLALAEEMLSASIEISRVDSIRPLETAYLIQGYANRIREACGVEP